ncbi:MAG TPA: TlpA disulfide reductase family protein [Puia sp.]
MTVRLIFPLLLLNLLTVATHGQDDPPPSVNIGDAAPPLRVRAWLKGNPIQQFEKGRIYVVEFWATWCHPCKVAMPHLSELAREYRNKVTFLGIDVYEKSTTSLEKIKHFVDSMGSRMDYNVAAEDSNFMEAGWLDSTGEKNKGIPRSFIVDAAGRLAWVGYPPDLKQILPQVLNNTWDIKAALAQRNLQRRLEFLDTDENFELWKFRADPDKPNDLGHPDSILLAIDKIVQKEPGLKYAPLMAYNTFSALLKTDAHKAYTYGKEVLASSFFGMTPFESIVNPLEYNEKKVTIPPDIYRLAAEALQLGIGQYPYPELVNIPKMYHRLADLYRRAGDEAKAIEAEKKSILSP